MGESRIIPTLHESGVHGWIWGQAQAQLVLLRWTKQQVTWRWQGIVGNQPSLKRQATSRRLDKLQAIGYYGTTTKGKYEKNNQHRRSKKENYQT